MSSELKKNNRSFASFNRRVSRREAVEAVKRLKPMHEGQSHLIRFAVGARIEHIVLMTAVTILAITGLAQTFDNTRIGQVIYLLLGGLEATQQIHHFFAFVLLGLSAYHLLNVLDGLFVRRLSGKMLPAFSDVKHIFQILGYNFGLTKKLPLVDRYSFDEKFFYWITVISIGILGFSGLGMLFPNLATQLVPGSFFPYAAMIHRWQAILVVVVTLLLHTYQVLLRKKNLSIFSGKMSLEDMLLDHPVELAYLQKAAALSDSTILPVRIKFSLDVPVVMKAAARVVETTPETEATHDNDEKINPADVSGAREVSENNVSLQPADVKVADITAPTPPSEEIA